MLRPTCSPCRQHAGTLLAQPCVAAGDDHHLHATQEGFDVLVPRLLAGQHLTQEHRLCLCRATKRTQLELSRMSHSSTPSKTSS